MTERQVKHSIAVLNVLISGTDNQNLPLQRFHKLAHPGFISNFKSFTLYSYKVSLIIYLKIFIDV